VNLGVRCCLIVNVARPLSASPAITPACRRFRNSYGPRRPEELLAPLHTTSAPEEPGSLSENPASSAPTTYGAQLVTPVRQGFDRQREQDRPLTTCSLQVEPAEDVEWEFRKFLGGRTVTGKRWLGRFEEATSVNGLTWPAEAQRCDRKAARLGVPDPQPRLVARPAAAAGQAHSTRLRISRAMGLLGIDTWPLKATNPASGA